MQRVHSRRSEASEGEMDGIAEQELAKLQRQYRIMEGDRKAYSEESQNVIRKQRSTIEWLQCEHEELMKDNRLAGSNQNLGKDNANTDTLSDLLTKEDQHIEDLTEIRDDIKELEAQTRVMEKKISQQRKNMGGVHMSHARHVQTQKQIRVLENRLNQASVKFNSALAENANLREQIENRKVERSTFEGRCEKFDKKIVELKKQISEVIEASTTAYDARDEAQAKMLALKEKADKDQAQYCTEFKELQRIIEHDQKLKEFMRVKGEERADMEGELSSRKKKKDEKDRGDKAEETIESYESAFHKIKEATGIEEIDRLVNRFIEVEDKNFALFNYVNEQNNEIEKLQDDICEAKADIEKFKSEGVEMEAQRKAILKGLEEQLNEATKAADLDDSQYKHVKKILEQLKTGIDSLFDKINCDKSVIENLLGSKEGITDNNMIQYLGIIEQRTNELLQVQSFQAQKDTERGEPAPVMSLLGQGPLPGANAVTIVPPSTGDDYDSDGSDGSGDDQRPMTQQELKNKIMKGITKREAHPKKTHHPGSATSDKATSRKKKAAK